MRIFFNEKKTVFRIRFILIILIILVDFYVSLSRFFFRIQINVSWSGSGSGQMIRIRIRIRIRNTEKNLYTYIYFNLYNNFKVHFVWLVFSWVRSAVRCLFERFLQVFYFCRLSCSPELIVWNFERLFCYILNIILIYNIWWLS